MRQRAMHAEFDIFRSKNIELSTLIHVVALRSVQLDRFPEISTPK